MKIKIIELLNRIAKGEIEDKRTFNLLFSNKIHRSIYYDDTEPNCMNCLKNVSDDEPIYDEIWFNDEVEIIKEDKTIEKLQFNSEEKYITTITGTTNKMRNIDVTLATKINELVKEINKMKEN